MKQCIQIVYDFFEENKDGSIRKYPKICSIPFSSKTTEYINSLSYEENMEAMIFDILEDGFVFVSDKVAVPIFNIKEFIASAPLIDDKKDSNVQNNNQVPINKWQNYKERKMNRRIGNKIHHNSQVPLIDQNKKENVSDAKDSAKEDSSVTIDISPIVPEKYL